MQGVLSSQLNAHLDLSGLRHWLESEGIYMSHWVSKWRDKFQGRQHWKEEMLVYAPHFSLHSRLALEVTSLAQRCGWVFHLYCAGALKGQDWQEGTGNRNSGYMFLGLWCHLKQGKVWNAITLLKAFINPPHRLVVSLLQALAPMDGLWIPHVSWLLEINPHRIQVQAGIMATDSLHIVVGCHITKLARFYLVSVLISPDSFCASLHN